MTFYVVMVAHEGMDSMCDYTRFTYLKYLKKAFSWSRPCSIWIGNDELKAGLQLGSINKKNSITEQFD